jgi:predicted nucleic acid-binding protein
LTLADTSVWVHHLRYGSNELRSLLNDGQVLCHPFIIGEVACGSLKNRSEVVDLLNALPQTHLAEHEEVFDLLHGRRLYSRGLGWIDLHLLASSILSRATLWTRDRRLGEVAAELSKNPVPEVRI